MIKNLHRLLLVAAATPLLHAQSVQGDDDGGTPSIFGPNFQVELPRWQANHGDNWRTRVDRTTGHLEMLFGGSAQPTFQPRTDADWVTLARQFVLETEDMHGIANSDLTVDDVVFLPLGMANGTDKMSVGLNQEIGGVRVENGGISVLFNMQGQLLSLHSTGAPRLSGASTSTSVSATLAAETAASIFAETESFTPDTVGTPELIFAQVEENGVRSAHLAWQIDVSFTQDDTVPLDYRYTIDARTAQMLRRDNNVHHFDVGGTINTMASPGSTADHAGNPPQALPATYVQITSSAGTIFADRDGNFNYPGVTGPLDITATYRSPYSNVNNQAGGDYSITFPGVSGTGNTLLMNPSPNQLLTAQANGMRHVGIARDFIRDTTASDATGDFLATTNVNMNANCNAYFNGNSINFYTAGGGCNNTAFSSVVAHEWGHWMNVRYGTGNGSDGMGEGNADLFSMYSYDDPVVGRFFSTGGGFVRTGTNNRQFCGDTNPGCHANGSVHANGEVWMGAAWKVRVNLNNSLGNALGDATSNQLFLGWMNAYNQTQIRSIIEIQWLTLDDDDGNIGNGTPNYVAIDNGFRQQGFPGYDLEYVSITNVTQVQNTQDPIGPYVVEADIDALQNPPISLAEVFFSVDSGPFQSVPMSLVAGNTFQGLIPGQIAPSRVDYYVSATDGNANSATAPDEAPGVTLKFYVGQVTDFLSNDFEGPGNQGWTVGAPGDSATTGIWTRQNPNGTAAQTEDDHTPAPGVNCWFTGQGAPGASTGSQDIDNGATTLVSPVFSMAGLDNPPISYWRWYVNDGNNAVDDSFVVEITNNGSTWTTVEILGPGNPQASGGWFQHEFSPHQFVALTATMQLRFRAADINSGSIVEAAIDDIQGVEVTSGCPEPITYCTGDPNSVGPGARMLFTGSQSIAADDANLFVFGAPAFEFGLFLYGQNQGSLPVGDGTLCVDNVFYRILPAVQTDLLGQASLQIPISNPSTPAAQISAGSIWNFQFWYRDGGGAVGNNLSDAMAIEFCD